MRIVTWYKSWFRTSGTLDVEGYVKHIVAAFAFFFGIGLLDAVVTMPLFHTVFASPLGWMGMLTILIWLSLALLAIGSLIGIFVTSTMRFVRYLMQPRGPDVSRRS
jgi:hypothetical protein